MIVGLVFVLSGLLKAVDPVGTALKIGQYLTPILDVHGPKGEVFTLVISSVAPSSCSELSCLWVSTVSSAPASLCSLCW